MRDRDFYSAMGYDENSSDGLKSQQVVAEQMREHNIWRDVMDSAEGAHVLREILEESGIFRTSYARGDQFETAFREGRRNLGLWLLNKMGEADSARTAEIMNSPNE